jgi:hypothetical protein
MNIHTTSPWLHNSPRRTRYKQPAGAIPSAVFQNSLCKGHLFSQLKCNEFSLFNPFLLNLSKWI